MRALQVVSIVSLISAIVDAFPLDAIRNPKRGIMAIPVPATLSSRSERPSNSFQDGSFPTTSALTIPNQGPPYPIITPRPQNSFQEEEFSVARLQDSPDSLTGVTSGEANPSASLHTSHTGVNSFKGATVTSRAVYRQLSSEEGFSGTLLHGRHTQHPRAVSEAAPHSTATTSVHRVGMQETTKASDKIGLDKSLLITFVVLGVLIAGTIITLLMVKLQKLCQRRNSNTEKPADNAAGAASPTGSSRSSMDFHDGPEKDEWTIPEGWYYGGSTYPTTRCGGDNYNLTRLPPGNLGAIPEPLGGRSHHKMGARGGMNQSYQLSHVKHAHPIPPAVALIASTSSRSLGESIDRPPYFAHSPITTVFDKNTNSYHIVEDPFAYKRREYH